MGWKKDKRAGNFYKKGQRLYTIGIYDAGLFFEPADLPAKHNQGINGR